VVGSDVATEERKASRVRLRSGRVGGVQRMHRGALGPDGYGFLIRDDDGQPKLALCYKTQEEAERGWRTPIKCWQTRYFLPEWAMRPIVPKSPSISDRAILYRRSKEAGSKLQIPGAFPS